VKSYRQGDVLITMTGEAIPETAKPLARDRGRCVLAYGEVTGHAHVITGPAELFDSDRPGVRYIRVGDGAELAHEEHGMIALPAGTGIVQVQREYSPAAIRNVAD
jgi:hypothetical protein